MKLNTAFILLSHATCVSTTNHATPSPSSAPTLKPSSNPSKKPSSKPSKNPSKKPSRIPSKDPSQKPSALPSKSPSVKPSPSPTIVPTNPTTLIPTVKIDRSLKPSERPSLKRSTEAPSHKPIRNTSSSLAPTYFQSLTPTVTYLPTLSVTLPIEVTTTTVVIFEIIGDESQLKNITEVQIEAVASGIKDFLSSQMGGILESVNVVVYIYSEFTNLFNLRKLQENDSLKLVAVIETTLVDVDDATGDDNIGVDIIENLIVDTMIAGNEILIDHIITNSNNSLDGLTGVSDVSLLVDDTSVPTSSPITSIHPSSMPSISSNIPSYFDRPSIVPSSEITSSPSFNVTESAIPSATMSDESVSPSLQPSSSKNSKPTGNTSSTPVKSPGQSSADNSSSSSSCWSKAIVSMQTLVPTIVVVLSISLIFS